MHGEKSKEWKKERFLMRKFKILCQEMEIHRALRIRDLDLKKKSKITEKMEGHLFSAFVHTLPQCHISILNFHLLSGQDHPIAS